MSTITLKYPTRADCPLDFNSVVQSPITDAFGTKYIFNGVAVVEEIRQDWTRAMREPIVTATLRIVKTVDIEPPV